MASMKKHQFLQVEYQSSIKLSLADERKLKLWLDLASEVAREMKILPSMVKSVRVSLLVCGDQKIRILNKEYRHKDKVTDVLSFPNHEDLRKGITKDQLINGELFLGDLAICLPRARKQALQFKIGLWDEFIHLFFHGVLHLIGYDHEVSEAEEKLMQKLEDSSIELFSKKRKGA